MACLNLASPQPHFLLQDPFALHGHHFLLDRDDEHVTFLARRLRGESPYKHYRVVRGVFSLAPGGTPHAARLRQSKNTRRLRFQGRDDQLIPKEPQR